MVQKVEHQIENSIGIIVGKTVDHNLLKETYFPMQNS